ncbi:hypothetical protein [Streptomonospora wellingtoniae]|uniref:Uncharacterized protein n=1 Tax=Streptomonospora wellingtoniae TaxID=3075544 RepID=A0ABU2KVV7_9ACTN|nr:hypothetical protein [Streptomonospora sp. DSM 45055]MDT0303422.1 hypothetical protein [Streptomonospora sp. DSM 45055]
MDRNIYRLFDLEEGEPTDVYSLQDAAADGYPVMLPKTVSVPLLFQREGIRYDGLSEEEKDAWDELERGDDGEVPDRVEADEVNAFREPVAAPSASARSSGSGRPLGIRTPAASATRRRGASSPPRRVVGRRFAEEVATIRSDPCDGRSRPRDRRDRRPGGSVVWSVRPPDRSSAVLHCRNVDSTPPGGGPHAPARRSCATVGHARHRGRSNGFGLRTVGGAVGTASLHYRCPDSTNRSR